MIAKIISSYQNNTLYFIWTEINIWIQFMVQLNFYSNVTLLAVYLSLNFSYVQHKLNMKFSFLFLFYDIHHARIYDRGVRIPWKIWLSLKWYWLYKGKSGSHLSNLNIHRKIPLLRIEKKSGSAHGGHNT